MKIFSKEESFIVLLILSVLFVISLFNFRTALMRSRDMERKNDTGDIVNALEQYKTDFSSYPQSAKDGKIDACNGGCVWGKDPLRDFSDLTYPPYMNTLPADPDNTKGTQYLYFSDGRRYQLYAALEDKEDAEYNPKIEARSLKCGIRICNFGRSSSKTPLDKSIEEYENELIQEQLRVKKLQLGK